MPTHLEITKTGGRIVLTAPDHPDLRRRIEALSGVRKGKFWTFAAQRELGVRELVRDLYGADAVNERPEDLVRLRVDMYFFGEGMTGKPGEAWIAGRLLARRPDRHDRVEYGDGVSLVSGSFADSAGSSQSPALRAAPGTVLEVRDLSRRDAEAARRDHSLSVAIVEPFTAKARLPAAPSRGLELPFDPRTRATVDSRETRTGATAARPAAAATPSVPKPAARAAKAAATPRAKAATPKAKAATPKAKAATPKAKAATPKAKAATPKAKAATPKAKVPKKPAAAAAKRSKAGTAKKPTAKALATVRKK